MEGQKQILERRYKLLKKIGEGSFGEVYKAVDNITKDKFAVKFETTKNHAQLNNEIQAYESLCNIIGIPKLYSHGICENKPYIVIDLFDSSLDTKFKEFDHQFSLKCSTLIALQLISRLISIHDNNYIHRDIKPANVMIGKRHNSKILYLIDFGLSKKFRDPVTKQHTIYREKRQLIGNFEYSSLNAHLGIEQSRRDDVESLFYLMLKLYKGTLPWDICNRDSSLYNKLAFISDLTVEKICEDCPSQYLDMLKYIRTIQFEERPNYDYLKNLLNELTVQNNLILEFDWIRLKNRKKHCKTIKHNKEYRRTSACIASEELSRLARPKHNINETGTPIQSASLVNLNSSFLKISDQSDRDLSYLRRLETIKDDNYPAFHNK